MFNGQFENELLEGESWFFGQQTQLPLHLQLLLDEQQKIQDIWELPKEKSPETRPIKMHFHDSKSF
jgi:hypothetical protein